jgi:hypothetical protein
MVALHMTTRSSRLTVLALVAGSIAILIPGLLLPVLTVRGVLTREGVAYVAPRMLDEGLSDETISVLKGMMNPSMVAILEATGADLREMILQRLGPQITDALQNSAADVEVYSQTRSILGAVRQLYDAGTPIPATLILLFSVFVPFGKAALVASAAFLADAEQRRRILSFVQTIGKWSMADVFVVALFITFLAAKATAAPTDGADPAPALIAFSAHFGPGFYWFAAYCLFSLATQQFIVRMAAAAAPPAMTRT